MKIKHSQQKRCMTSQEEEYMKWIPNKSKKQPSVSGNWFYMNDTETSIRCIYEAIKEENGLDSEIWEELGVMEVNLTDKSSIDFEQLKPYFKDKKDDAYLKDNNIHSLYMVTFKEQDYDRALQVFKKITSICHGYFVEDTLEFTNIIK